MLCSRAVVSWLIALAAAAAFVPPTAAGSREGFCSTLQRVLDAAEAGDGFAGLRGRDAGLYHETNTCFNGAQFCLVVPDEHPLATWRALVSSEDGYITGIRSLQRLAQKIENCLGEGWSRTESDGGRWLRELTFRDPRSETVVRALVTQEVQALKGWKSFRLVVVVFSARGADEAPQ